MPAGPSFGCAANTLNFSIQEQADMLELQDGYNTLRFLRKINTTMSETREELTDYGIAPSTDATNNPFKAPLESISMTETEDVIMHESWNQNGANTAIETQGGPLTGVDALLVVRLEQRWSVQGKGVVPDRETAVPWKAGDDVPANIVIGSATGGVTPTLTITIPVGAQCESVNRENQNTDFQTFTLEFLRYIPQTAADASDHLITLPGFVNDALLSDVALAAAGAPYFKITKTTTMGARAFASTQHSLEVHEPQEDLSGTP